MSIVLDNPPSSPHVDTNLLIELQSGKNFKTFVPRLLRYPGGKRRLIPFLAHLLPTSNTIIGRFIEPFVGSASVFFFLEPRNAIISDLNFELIELYKALKYWPSEIWDVYKAMPSDKKGYYQIRAIDPLTLTGQQRAARLLYLNRTCFKGMWRHNKKGQFNIGYGGQSRRWVITQSELIEVSHRLKNADIRCSDFQPIIEESQNTDFLFLDPPYKPGDKQMNNAHYIGQVFTYYDQQRLASALQEATKRNVPWVLTNSTHKDILNLYSGNYAMPLSIGTGKRPGILTKRSEEMVIFNELVSTKYPYLAKSSVSML
jgi:DNA adenine methylase